MSSKYVTQAEAPNRTETNKYLNASGHWTVPAGGGGGSGTASDITYDNTDSGLSSTNVQDAIDEIAQGGGGGSDERAMISDAWSPSINYTVGRYAIDGNKLYKCIVANTNMRPSTSPLYWEETDVCSEIYESNNYSTTEKQIGTWIDGKPLYRRTFDVGYLPGSSSYTTTPVSNWSDIKYIHKVYGVAIRDSDKVMMMLPFTAYSDANNNVQVFVFGGNIQINTITNRSAYHGYITLEYTKTTD